MKKGFMRLVVTTLLASSLFATSAFAAGGSLAVREKESNNTVGTAHSMFFHTPWYTDISIYGTVNGQTDTDDWFKLVFDTDDSGYTKVDSTITFNGTPDSSYEVTVLDSDENMRGYKVVPGGGTMTLRNITVDNGDYLYFHVKYKSGTPTMPYIIQVYGSAR